MTRPARHPEHHDEWRRRYEAGETAAEIARSHGINDSTVFWHLHRMGVQLRRRGYQRRSEPKRIPISKGLPPAPEARVWCEQCQRRVKTDEAKNCRSPWCKA